MAHNHNLFGIIGWKNSGKTTLVAALVERLSARGYTISTVKHAHHEFDIDRPNTDTSRHRQAGAKETAIVSDKRWALMHELRGEKEPSLADIVVKLSPCDLVLVESYKRETHKKLEVLGSGMNKNNEPFWPQDENIVAVVGHETPEDCALPCFLPGGIDEIAEFVLAQFGLDESGPLRHAGE